MAITQLACFQATIRHQPHEGEDGALILAPTHTLEPEVPLENIEAFVETVREYGEIS